jgi:ATP-dependent Clp protease ATP-binding subunit ClpA
VFERLTPGAHRVLQVAQQEARMLGHDHVGTEHLLLGMTHEGQGVAAEALESFGASLGAIRYAIEVAIGAGGSSPTGSLPLTPRAKHVMELALREALRLRVNDIGTEHLLLGLLGEDEGVGAQVLVGLGADLGALRESILQTLDQEADLRADDVDELLSAPGIDGIFEPALGESRRLGDLHIGLEHALLAAFERPESLACRVLASFGLTKPEVEQRLLGMRGEGQQATPE